MLVQTRGKRLFPASRYISHIMRILLNRSKRFKLYLLLVTFGIIIWITGLDLILREECFAKFKYPLQVKDEVEFVQIVNEFRMTSQLAIPPTNTFYSKISFAHHPYPLSCPPEESNDLLILVKSAPQNFQNRDAIRKTWKTQKESSRVSCRIMFFLGRLQKPTEEFKAMLVHEIEEHSDLVIIDYEDSYYNNTIKTVMEMRYAVEYCDDFKYAFLVDDDYFVNVQNLFNFAKSLQLDRVYAGFTFYSKPLRHRFFNKWAISLEEYPYSYFPHYVTAGNILLSKEALNQIYYSTFYVKPFRFDDIYVSICAKKLGIKPVHSNLFKFWEDSDEVAQKDLIAAHGYGPDKLMRFWDIQKTAGFV